MSVIAIPSVLTDKLGNKGAEAFTEIIKEIDLEARKEAITISDERFERRLAEEMGKVRTEIATAKSELKTEIERNKSETLKWMFIFWIGQIAVLSGIIFTMLKLYFRD